MRRRRGENLKNFLVFERASEWLVGGGLGSPDSRGGDIRVMESPFVFITQVSDDGLAWPRLTQTAIISRPGVMTLCDLRSPLKTVYFHLISEIIQTCQQRGKTYFELDWGPWKCLYNPRVLLI